MICWKIRIFAYWTTPQNIAKLTAKLLWFAEKFVSLLIEQHPRHRFKRRNTCCDLLKNSYLCLLNNTKHGRQHQGLFVVICWKIRIFAYWTTPKTALIINQRLLWFAEKFVSLLIEQHRHLSGISLSSVVICWKIRIFAYWTTPFNSSFPRNFCCDLLKNSYLCLLNNTWTRTLT